MPKQKSKKKSKSKTKAPKVSIVSRQSSRFWCFTINNEKYQNCKFPTDVYDYCIMGNEVGKKGTPHIQGFVVMKVRTEFTRMAKLLPRARLSVMYEKSRPEYNSEYCKKDGDYFEDGNILDIDYRGGASGGNAKHVKYTEFIDAAKKRDFATIEEELPHMFVNHYHTMKRIAMDNPKKHKNLTGELENMWIWGEPGLGKSSWVDDQWPGLYRKPKSKWWLGYKGEDTVFVEEVGHGETAWIGEFLKLWADRYPVPVETKMDGECVRPQRIIVTSNYTIEELWPNDRMMQAALKRRFKVIEQTREYHSIEKRQWMAAGAPKPVFKDPNNPADDPQLPQEEEEPLVDLNEPIVIDDDDGDSVLDLTHLCSEEEEASLDLDELNDD